MTSEMITTLLFILEPNSNKDVFAKLNRHLSSKDKEIILSELFDKNIPNKFTEQNFFVILLKWIKNNDSDCDNAIKKLVKLYL